MTSLFSNAELLYSMPAVGPTKTTTAISVVTQPVAAAYQLPALGALWAFDQLPGQALHIVAGGTFDGTAVTNLMNLGFNTAVGTLGVNVAATGALTMPALTTGMWELDCDIQCVGNVSATATNWFASGKFFVGAGNNAATAAGATYGFGGANTLGVPTAVSLDPTQRYFIELHSTWGTAPTAFVCSKFKVYAEN